MTIAATVLDDGRTVLTGLPGPQGHHLPPALLNRREVTELYLALRDQAAPVEGVPVMTDINGTPLNLRAMLGSARGTLVAAVHSGLPISRQDIEVAIDYVDRALVLASITLGPLPEGANDVSVEVRESVIHRCPRSGEWVMPCCGLPPGERLGDRMTARDDMVTCNQPEAVWSLRRIYETLGQVAPSGGSVAGMVQKALTMLAWHVEHGEAEAITVAETRARTRADELRGHLKAAHEHLCSAQVHCVIVASRVQLGEAIDRISYVAGREGVDPGDTFTAPDVIDAVIEGEFTDHQAAMIIALVAVCRATHDGAHPVSAPGYVRKAADVVRMARGADTPGWDEADILMAIEAVTS